MTKTIQVFYDKENRETTPEKAVRAEVLTYENDTLTQRAYYWPEVQGPTQKHLGGAHDESAHGRRGVTQLNTKAFKKFRDANRTARIETVRVVVNGSEMLTKTGGRDSIEFSDDELHLFRDSVSAHNHPDGAPLSMQDLELAIKTDSAAIETFGVRNDENVRWIASRPENGWPDFASVEAIENEVYARFREEGARKIMVGALTTDQANDWIWGKAMDGIREGTGIQIERIVEE